MKSKVWFVPVAAREPSDRLARKAADLAETAGLANAVRKDGLVGILQHVGEGAGVGYVKPAVTRAIAAKVRALGGKPFLTGSATLYRGWRSNACDHLMQAYEHGFTPMEIGCPVIMSDGLRGSDRVAVRVPNARHCREAFLGSAVALMDGMVVVTHPTGHVEAGFGAAIKNVSMGLASRGGKMAMHHGGYPVFIASRCTACGRCARWCPEDAIAIEKKAGLIREKCIGCGQCLSVCPSNAVDFRWAVSGLAFQEKLVEYCLAVSSLLKGRILYVSVVTHVQEGCDCIDEKQEAICPDIGLVASEDLVAIDMATADLVEQRAGRDIIRELTGREYRKMLAYAESVGLGSRDYALVEA